MYRPKTGVYAGSFDPVTRGHLDIIFQAATLMDRLYVVVGVNATKTPLFTADERAEMIRQDIEDIVKPKLKAMGRRCRIDVAAHGGLTAAFMKAHDAPFYVRGLRMGFEFDAEYPQLVAGRNEYAGFTPVFLCASDPQLHVVSSTIAREVERFGGESTEKYVTPRTAEKLRARMTERGLRPGGGNAPSK